MNVATRDGNTRTLDAEPDYLSVYGAIPTPSYVADTGFVIRAVNDALLAATLRSRDDLVGRPVLEAFPGNPGNEAADGPRNLLASLEYVRKHRQAHTMPILNYDIARADGTFETRYWAAVSAPVLDRDGELRWIVHQTTDVTAWVQAKAYSAGAEDLRAELRTASARMEAEVFTRRRLEQDNETLQTLIDGLSTAVIGADRDGWPVLSNAAARALIGDDIGAVPVTSWPERLHMSHLDGRPLDDEDLPVTRVLHGEPANETDLVVAADRAPRRVFRVNSRPIKEQPQLAAVMALQDVTLQHRTARLKECELEIAALLAQPSPVDEILARVVESIGRMSAWAAVEFWRLDDAADLLRCEVCWSDADLAMPAHTSDVLRSGEKLPGQAWQRGVVVWERNPAQEAGLPRAVLAVPVPSGGGTLGVLLCYSTAPEILDDVRTAVLTGVAAQIAEFLERRRAERLAAELEQTRDEYVALVGHELRTPLTSIQAYTDLLLDDPDLTADQRTMLQNMRRNAAGLHRMVGKLLDVAGMRLGHIEMQSRRIDLAPVVEAAVEAAAASEIPIDVHMAAPLEVEGDPERLRQVVDELLSNALVWAEQGTGVGVDVRADGRTVTLSVSNTGARITAAEHERLFDLFFRGEAALHNGIPGTGLGLTVARAIVEQHGGTISINGADEPVTVFTVRLPAH